ncbi:MAG: hypothetical protein QOG64_2246, partial [Acidimicrobiaceae bacterium]|nr:hypothetical protein [Acidimicrobiaceae bacterium]
MNRDDERMTAVLVEEDGPVC